MFRLLSKSACHTSPAIVIETDVDESRVLSPKACDNNAPKEIIDSTSKSPVKNMRNNSSCKKSAKSAPFMMKPETQSSSSDHENDPVVKLAKRVIDLTMHELGFRRTIVSKQKKWINASYIKRQQIGNLSLNFKNSTKQPVVLRVDRRDHLTAVVGKQIGKKEKVGMEEAIMEVEMPPYGRYNGFTFPKVGKYQFSYKIDGSPELRYCLTVSIVDGVDPEEVPQQKRPVCSLKKMTNKNDNKLQKSKNANKENVELESKTTSSDSTSLASSTSDELPLQTRAVSPPYDFKWNELKEQNSFFKFSQFDEELEAFNQERLSRKAEANTKSNYHRNLRSKKDVPKKNKIPEIDMQKERGLLFGAITNHAELPNASGNKFPHLSPFEFRSLASLKQTPIQCHDVRAPEAIRSSPVSFSRWDNAFVNQKQKEVFIRITSSFEFVPHHISVTRGTFINWILDDDVMGVCEFSLVGVESNHSSSNYFLPVVFRSYVLQKKCCNGYGISTNAFPSSVTYWCEINTDMKASITIIDNVDENLSIFDNDPSLLSSTKVCEFDKSGKESVEVDKLISSSSTNNIPENDLSKLPSRRNAKQKLNGRNKYKRQNYFDSHDRAVKKIPKFGRKKTRDKGFRHVKKNSIGSDTVSTMCEEQKIKNDEKCDESSTVTKSNRMQKIERTILETLPPSSPTLKVKCNSFSTDCEHGVILKTSDLSINTPKDCDKFVLQNQVPDKLIPNLHSFVSTEFAVSSTLVPEKSKLGNYLLKRMCTVIDDSMQDHSIIFL